MRILKNFVKLLSVSKQWKNQFVSAIGPKRKFAMAKVQKSVGQYTKPHALLVTYLKDMVRFETSQTYLSE